MDTCQEEKTSTLQELTPRARAQALDDSRNVHTDYDWWSDVYIDAIRIAELLGIEIERRGRGDATPALYFSGFWSQGDGACFAGTYRLKADTITAVAAEIDDIELASLAERLTVVAVTLALAGVEDGWSATITTRGHYSHSGTMNADIKTEEDYSEAVNALIQTSEEEVQCCMRDFADWIYARLQAEHEHLTSDDTIAETLISDETKFDKDGAII